MLERFAHDFGITRRERDGASKDLADFEWFYDAIKFKPKKKMG